MNIVLAGYYGAGNLGDELLLSQLLERLEAARQEVVGVVTLDAVHTSMMHGCAAIQRDDLHELVQRIANADVLVMGGGGLFQDHHRFAVADLGVFPAPGVSYYAQLCLLARRVGVPYMLFAMGVGPLQTAEAREVTREIFQHAAHVSVRDQVSATLLRQIGVTREVVVGADPGWLVPCVDRMDLGQQFPALSGRPVAVVVPRDWPFTERWRQSLAAGLEVLEEAGWAILWLPFQTSEHGNDLGIVDELRRGLNRSTPQAIARCARPEEAARIIGSANALVAMRLHALILGLQARVPSLAVEYDEKLAAVASACQLPRDLRLSLSDSASHFRAGVQALIGAAADSVPIGQDNVAGLADAARHTYEALLFALQLIPHRSTCTDWHDRGYDWVAQWSVEYRVQAERRIASLLVTNARQASQLEDIRCSQAWRMAAPLRASERALTIIRSDGWGVFLGKLYRLLFVRISVSMLKAAARRRMLEILHAHPGCTPVLFPPIVAWNMHLFQRPHHLAKELAARSYLYFFCIPASPHDQVMTFDEVAPGCFITPHFDLVEALPGKIVHLYSTDNIHTLEWIRNRLQHGDQVLYEYVDEIHEDISQRDIPAQVIEKHHYLLRNEEIACVATADKLYREVCANRSRNCALITNGVDIERFSVRRGDRAAPEELVDVVATGRPVIGYFGALAKWFDYDLVIRLGQLRPAYEIVLIGPDYDGSMRVLEAAGLPNLRMLGPVDYKRLPDYACWFDVSVIPFRINEITESTSPIKLFEYMALGHPIVTTNMPECRKYQSVLIGDGVDQFIRQVERALSLGDDATYQSTLSKEALANSWSSKADALDQLLRNSTLECTPPRME